MKTRSPFRTGAVLALSLLLFGCDPGTGPIAAPADPEPAELLNIGSVLEPVVDLLDELTTLKRTTAVTEGECASVSVGPGSGSVECAQAGLRLEIPAGALSETVQISVNIPRGDLVGYEFAPHGLEFDRKVRLHQSLGGTEAEGDDALLKTLLGAYVSEIGDLVSPLETYLVTPKGGDPGEISYRITHFSGYVCASD